MTLLLPWKRSADNKNCECVNSAAEERLFPAYASIPLKRKANPKAPAKSGFYGRPWRHTSSLKPFELAGSASVKPKASLSEGLLPLSSPGRSTKGPFPSVSLCILPWGDPTSWVVPAQLKKRSRKKKAIIAARAFRKGQCMAAPQRGG